jgi:myo-inositol-1(or 4)-monophosphatase
MRVSSAGTLIDSLLCTGFPYTVQTDGDYLLALFGEFLKKARAVRRLGSAAIDLAYVAAGRFDGFWEVRLNPWDVSAGALLITEAGGQVSNLAGGPFESRLGEVVASNGRIHTQMVDTIRSTSAEKRFGGPP